MRGRLLFSDRVKLSGSIVVWYGEAPGVEGETRGEYNLIVWCGRAGKWNMSPKTTSMFNKEVLVHVEVYAEPI